MRKEFGDDQVRITVRLPQHLYAALVSNDRHTWKEATLSRRVRTALEHLLTCPVRLQDEAEAQAAAEARSAEITAQMAAWEAAGRPGPPRRRTPTAPPPALTDGPGPA